MEQPPRSRADRREERLHVGLLQPQPALRREGPSGSAYRELVLVNFGGYRCADRVEFRFEGLDLIESVRVVKAALDRAGCPTHRGA